MTASDPIADIIIQVKNASAAGKESVVVPYSKLRLEIAEVLKKKGYLASVEKRGRKTSKEIEVGIAYGGKKAPKVHDVKRVSKPSRRVYLGADEIRPVRQGHGDLILSTPEGILTGSDARKKGVGGEALFEIW